VIASLRAQSLDRCEIINLGNNNPVKLMEFIDILEDLAGRKAMKELVAAQPGDIVSTYADITRAGKKLGFKPRTSLRQGLERFVAWYRDNPELTEAVIRFRRFQEEQWAPSGLGSRGTMA
jgi:UDP-glucuronate 4-epimerase